jgi:hypothetical protein
MGTATTPRIRSVLPESPLRLRVVFENGVEKEYDCSQLLGRPEFSLLKTPAFFRTVRVDPGGYGISWNDAIDLSEYELWHRGETK